MKAFPAFVDLDGKEILIVGAGEVAARKIDRLLAWEPALTIVAPRMLPEVEALDGRPGITLTHRPFQMDDLEGKDLVIVAADDLELQRTIFEECERRRVLCNCVDVPEYCSFIFPALIKRGDLVIAISTSGRAPALAGAIRRFLEAVLPEDFEENLEHIAALRASLPKGPERMEQVRRVADEVLMEMTK